jgi:hypothetical protein
MDWQRSVEGASAPPAPPEISIPEGPLWGKIDRAPDVPLRWVRRGCERAVTSRHSADRLGPDKFGQRRWE